MGPIASSNTVIATLKIFRSQCKVLYISSHTQTIKLLHIYVYIDITSIFSDSFLVELVFKFVKCLSRRLILSYTISVLSLTCTLEKRYSILPQHSVSNANMALRLLNIEYTCCASFLTFS